MGASKLAAPNDEFVPVPFRPPTPPRLTPEETELMRQVSAGVRAAAARNVSAAEIEADEKAAPAAKRAQNGLPVTREEKRLLRNAGLLLRREGLYMLRGRERIRIWRARLPARYCQRLSSSGRRGRRRSHTTTARATRASPARPRRHKPDLNAGAVALLRPNTGAEAAA